MFSFHFSFIIFHASVFITSLWSTDKCTVSQTMYIAYCGIRIINYGYRGGNTQCCGCCSNDLPYVRALSLMMESDTFMPHVAHLPQFIETAVKIINIY